MDSHKSRAKTFCPNSTDQVGKGGHQTQQADRKTENGIKKTGPGLIFGVTFLRVLVSREFHGGLVISRGGQMTTRLFWVAVVCQADSDYHWLAICGVRRFGQIFANFQQTPLCCSLLLLLTDDVGRLINALINWEARTHISLSNLSCLCTKL